MSRRLRNTIRSLALILALQPVIAAAQNFGNVPANSVIGRGGYPVGGGPAQAIPFSTLVASLLSGPLAVPSVNTNSIIFTGSTSGAATVSAQNAAGSAIIKLPTTSGTLADSAAAPLALDAVTGVLTCPTCATTASASAAVFVASRSVAAGLDLHLSNVVQTGGYAVPGDGGGATFKNVGSAPFLDSFISGGTIVGGSGYVSGTYFGVTLSGGTGLGALATVTVTSGVVTGVTIANSPGNGYTVGDVLTVPNTSLGGSGTGFKFTVTTVSIPFASFVDAVGTHFQYVVDTGGFPNIKQFGARMDGDGNGAGTDDTAAIQAALWYTGRRNVANQDSGGFQGGKLIAPVGVSNICTPGAGGQIGLVLVVPFGVQFDGAKGGTTLRVCDNVNTNASVIFLGDPQTRLASFKSMLSNMTVFGKRGIATAPTTAMIASNNTQDGGGLDHVYIYAGQRECIDFSIGYGGASTVYMNDVSCSLEGANTGAVFNYGTTLVNMKNMVFGAPSSGTNNTALTMVLNGGMYRIEGFHTEEIPVGIQVNMSGVIQENMVTIQNATGGTGCSSLIVLTTGNNKGNTALQQVVNNGCTTLVTNGQSGGTNRAGPVLTTDGTVFFNP